MWKNLQQNIQKVQQSGGRFGGGGGPSPRGMAGGIGLAVAGIAGVYLFNNALFNVDGGCRAVKYSRYGKVKNRGGAQRLTAL